MADLPPDLGYELVNPPLLPGAGFRFGRGTRVHVSKSTIGGAEVASDDNPLARSDGIVFGRDYLRGRNITFDINIKTKSRLDVPSARDLFRAMETSWNTEDTLVGPSRMEPGLVSELFIHDGDLTLIAYGRPRDIVGTRGTIRQGWIPVTCSFRMVTHKFYSYLWQQNVITIAPPTATGFEYPFAFPLYTVSMSTTSDSVQVGGNTDTWMLSRIDGPITAPAIEVVDYYRIETTPDFTLGAFDWLEIDPRPWNRRILKNGTQPVAGKFTQQSRRPSVQTLPPGNHRIVLEGTDPTGTSRLTTRWRDAYSSW